MNPALFRRKQSWLSEPFYPAYLALYESGELDRRVERGLRQLESCTVCPRDCRVNRLRDEKAVCHTGRYAVVGSYFDHHGEEDCIRGWNGSGTIFFSHCNLKCVFCQNYDISQQGAGEETRPERLAAMMLELQEGGCHNINLVTPEHVVPQIVEALPLAVEGGLRLPIVYNTSGYDSLESLALLDGIVDIYMPDFKYWDAGVAQRLSKAKNYPDAVRAALREMHRQVGDLVVGEDGLARRGLLVRHLVMPNRLAGTREVMRFLVNEISPGTFVNLMSQYRPAGKVGKPGAPGQVLYPEINRRITTWEFQEALRIAREEGVTRLDQG
ncbi:MAG: radical SAM protein [Acidobacteria bacterium]|nr:radical SAM protein [Acidobacteriota bacterium]